MWAHRRARYAFLALLAATAVAGSGPLVKLSSNYAINGTCEGDVPSPLDWSSDAPEFFATNRCIDITDTNSSGRFLCSPDSVNVTLLNYADFGCRGTPNVTTSIPQECRLAPNKDYPDENVAQFWGCQLPDSEGVRNVVIPDGTRMVLKLRSGTECHSPIDSLEFVDWKNEGCTSVWQCAEWQECEHLYYEATCLANGTVSATTYETSGGCHGSSKTTVASEVCLKARHATTNQTMLVVSLSCFPINTTLGEAYKEITAMMAHSTSPSSVWTTPAVLAACAIGGVVLLVIVVAAFFRCRRRSQYQSLSG